MPAGTVTLQVVCAVWPGATVANDEGEAAFTVQPLGAVSAMFTWLRGEPLPLGSEVVVHQHGEAQRRGHGLGGPDTDPRRKDGRRGDLTGGGVDGTGQTHADADHIPPGGSQLAQESVRRHPGAA